jgi:pyruvate/2-oxoglutarate/acetoin dehydrogenase E1 component
MSAKKTKHTVIINHGKKNHSVGDLRIAEVLMHVVDALLDSNTNSVIIYKDDITDLK